LAYRLTLECTVESNVTYESEPFLSQDHKQTKKIMKSSNVTLLYYKTLDTTCRSYDFANTVSSQTNTNNEGVSFKNT